MRNSPQDGKGKLESKSRTGESGGGNPNSLGAKPGRQSRGRPNPKADDDNR